MDEVVKFGEDGTSLLWLPRGVAWWAAPHGFAVADGKRLWIEHAACCCMVPMNGRPDVWALEQGLIAEAADGEGIRVFGDDVTRVRARHRHDGADVVVERIAGDLRFETALGELAVPDSIAEQRDVRPWTTGKGLLWLADGFAYRWDMRAIRPIGPVARDARWIVGPQGALVVGDAHRWTHAAGPRKSLAALAVPLDVEPWGIRFSADGERIAGLHGEEMVRLDLVTHAVLERRADRLPLDADDTRLDGDAVRTGTSLLRRGIGEHSWALSGNRLGGPGGVVWDLATARRCFDEPVLRLGATAATGRDWITIGWDGSGGRWFDPRTGAVRHAFVINLHADDAIESATASAGVAYIRTILGHVFRVDGPDVQKTVEYPDPEPLPDSGDGWSLAAGILRVAGHRPMHVGAEAAARVGQRVYAWSTDGLLIAVAVE